jgi:hypothetical protein
LDNRHLRMGGGQKWSTASAKQRTRQ